MRTFKDSTGRAWTVEITVGSVQRARDLAGVDLLDPGALNERGEALMTRLALDLILFGQTLYALCKPQADAAGLNDEGFAGLLSGETLRGAYDAVWDEWADFFRCLRRPHLVAALEKVTQLVRRVTEATAQRVAAIDAGEPLGSTTSTASPAASASTPGR